MKSRFALLGIVALAFAVQPMFANPSRLSISEREYFERDVRLGIRMGF